MTSNNARPPVQKKLVIVGDVGCGKTCLLIVFVKNEFPEERIPVLENYVLDIFVDNQHVEMSLWDTAGQEEYDRLRPLSYYNSDVVLMCFSLDNEASFYNVSEKWKPEVSHYIPRVPIILVGTKKDLRTKSNSVAEQVTYEKGLEMKEKIQAHEYLECSSKTRGGVKEVFEAATRVALKNNLRKPNARICKIL
ncbi:ras-like GTP-binding protein Rho1 [Patella vulgata]|uniref:ras-like GTP-binding protein Rho1 n=1 Tax=Patella vulgata TaxID=6465 RepID=UPI00217FFC2D|nr:ras-like GTP-binding protein Rho1 [Patella vulgata]XP_050409007.1 ras-like GTP-binding protein Rho1 [Patella vulgata]XP_050409008.1 ras-like GTP-binding protein Rho1 [Patella vulgata]XP_050409010.1 ras-like GTP-binding protein Rho1 [Patella vulgata]